MEWNVHLARYDEYVSNPDMCSKYGGRCDIKRQQRQQRQHSEIWCVTNRTTFSYEWAVLCLRHFWSEKKLLRNKIENNQAPNSFQVDRLVRNLSWMGQKMELYFFITTDHKHFICWVVFIVNLNWIENKKKTNEQSAAGPIRSDA